MPAVGGSAGLKLIAESLITAPGERLYSISHRLLGALVLGLFLVVYILPLGHRPLFSPDETRYAEIPREMLSTGDWVVPRLNGLRYFEKPPFGYWVNAVSLSLFGENAFAARISSPVSAGLTALLVYFFTLRINENRRTGLLGAAVYLTFAGVYAVGTFSVLDNILTLCITAGIYAYYCAVAGVSGAKPRMYALLSGIAFGCAFLTKGFLGFVVPGIVLLPWLILTGRLRSGLERGLLAAAAALVVALPWALLIHWRESDFWHYFFWEEHVRRFLSDNAQHKRSAFYFLTFLPLLGFPWIGLIPAASAGLRAMRVSESKKAFVRLLWLWALLPFVFFSASSGKLMTYILPCFPPLAALVAVGLTAYLSLGHRRLFNFGLVFVSGVLALLLVALLVGQTGGVFEPVYRADEGFRAWLLGVSLLLGAGFGLTAVKSTRAKLKLAGCVASMVPLLAVAQIAMPEAIIENKAPEVLLARHASQISSDPIIVSNSGVVRTVAWFFKRDDVYLTVRGGELLYGLDYPDAANRYLDESGFVELIRKNDGRRDVVMVCKRDCGEGYESRMTPSAQRYEYGPYTLWHMPSAGRPSGN